LPYQSGWTRKMLILTCGFTILLSTIYYQCNLLQQLMLPKQISQITLDDIVNEVKSKRSKLFLTGDTVDVISGLVNLQNALLINPPLIDQDWQNWQNETAAGNLIIMAEMSVILHVLSYIKPEECSKYAIVELNEVGPAWATMMLNKKRRDLLEPLNVIVAERMNFVTQLLEKDKTNEECMKHIYPKNIAEPKFQQMTMYTLSGIFALLVALLIFAAIVFLVEVFSTKLGYKPEMIKKQTLTDKIDKIISYELLDCVKLEDADAILAQYYVFRDMLHKHVIL
jgi:hypothetical protein